VDDSSARDHVDGDHRRFHHDARRADDALTARGCAKPQGLPPRLPPTQVLRGISGSVPLIGVPVIAAAVRSGGHRERGVWLQLFRVGRTDRAI